MWEQMGIVFLGLSFGGFIANGLVAFIIALGIFPRYAGITKTGKKVRLYEDCILAGAVAGSVWYFHPSNIPFGNIGLCVLGLFFGIFLGSWIVALSEIVNAFSIMIRRIGITKAPWIIILAMALGKTLGSILFFWKGW